MASGYNSVWAIDIGNNSLKALRLRNTDGVVEVIGFDNVQHGKVLTGSGIKPAERDELIALSLRQFIKQNDLGKDDIIVSVPSQNSFARFVKLPPVESKRIPEIVKFEAAQQIPFDINDVQWDWQMMTKADSPEIRVGIFAVKSDVVSSVLEHFSRENITVKCVQMAPMALYNYALYDYSDLGKTENQATVILDIGAENSDLVVCTQSSVWQRCVPMGGNAFTRAIADAFKLNFEKAEKLKHTAAMSKYARQVFQAMKPVFTDLASEIQRSLGFYTSSNPNAKLSRVIALGGGTKMRGLVQYLRQTLQIPVEMPDSFKKLAISSSVSAAKFHESVCDFGVVYGLGLQGLDLARIESNLLPRSIARSMAWAGKAKYFIAAACLVLLVSLMSFARTFLDRASYTNNEQVRQKIGNIINTAGQAGNKLKDEEGKGIQSAAIIEKEFKPFAYRDVVPLLLQTLISVLPNEKNNPAQKELYEAFAQGDVTGVKGVERNERKQIFVTGILVYYVEDIASAQFGASADFMSRGSQKEAQLRPEDLLNFDEFGGGMKGSKGSKYGRKVQTRNTTGAPGEAGSEPGFIVTITGYSPYKDLGELMDPIGVEGDPNKWGVVTRLMRLNNIVGWKNPFELYNKKEIKHFKYDSGEVAVGTEMPIGIGIEEIKFERTKNTEERILKDPMTGEVICRVPELDESGKIKVNKSGKVVYKVNDHWFQLNIKFVWKDAKKENTETDQAGDVAGNDGTSSAVKTQKADKPQKRSEERVKEVGL